MDAQRITVQDALWLNMDRPNNLMIIDSVMWFSEQPDWDKVRRVIHARLIQRFPVFSAKAVKRKDGQYWVPDPNFDLEDHIIVPDLGAPVTMDAVRTYLEAQRSKPLPKSKPLWQFHFISNVVTGDGREVSIVMSRIHHAIADGVRLTQVILGLCDPISGDAGVEATVGKQRSRDAAAAGEEAGGVARLLHAAADVGEKTLGVGGAVAESLASAVGLAKDSGSAAASALTDKAKQVGSDPVAAARSIPGAVADIPDQLASLTRSGQEMFDDALDVIGDPSKLMDAFTAMAPVTEEATNTAVSVAKLAFAPPSVKTAWSGTPGKAKKLQAADAFPLALVKEIGKQTGTTVNDVLLTVIAGTMQRYLAEHNASVPEIMWMIPVSLRPFDPGMPKELGNHFALIALQMPLDIDDPAKRLREIHKRINKIKKSQEAVVTFGVQRVVASSPEDISVFLTNFFANKAVGVLTNVPGPRSQIALAGTPVEGMLGWAPSSGDQPMTVTIFSYDGRVYVGFGTDASLIPDGDRFPELFVEAFRALYRSVTGQEIGRDDHPVLD